MFALDKVRLLLTYGADVNRLDGTHTSPLISALTTRPPHHPGEAPDNESYMSMVRLLLAAGARLSSVVLERIKVRKRMLATFRLCTVCIHLMCLKESKSRGT